MIISLCVCVYVLRNNLSLYLHDIRCAIYDAQVHASFDYIFTISKCIMRVRNIHSACMSRLLILWPVFCCCSILTCLFRHLNTPFHVPLHTRTVETEHNDQYHRIEKKILCERNHFKSQHIAYRFEVAAAAAKRTNFFLQIFCDLNARISNVYRYAYVRERVVRM